MSANHTPNFNLCQWEEGDKVLRTEFNADNAAIDASLGALSTAVSGLTATVGRHTASLAGKGNCSVMVHTYTATGFSGETSPSSISCPGRPVAVLIANSDCNVVLMRGLSTASVRGKYGIEGIITAAWGSDYVRWYGSSARAQMNETGKYTAIVLMQED